MFDIGFWEIGLIFIVLLLVVGPERLPKVVRTLGLWIGKARRMVAEVKAEVDRELRVEELKQSFQQQVPSDEFKRLASQVRSINQEVNKEVRDSIDQSTRQPVPQQTPGQAESARSDLEKPNLGKPNFDKPPREEAGGGTPKPPPAAPTEPQNKPPAE